MSHSTTDELVIEISRDLVMQLAPEEVSLFRATSQAFLQNPKRVLADQNTADDMLGFGLGEAATLITPAVLTVASSVINFLVGEIAKSASAESASLIQNTVRQLFKRFRLQAETNHEQRPALTTEQLTQVQSIALKQARQMRLSDTRARVLADAIVGSLAVANGV